MHVVIRKSCIWSRELERISKIGKLREIPKRYILDKLTQMICLLADNTYLPTSRVIFRRLQKFGIFFIKNVLYSP